MVTDRKYLHYLTAALEKEAENAGTLTYAVLENFILTLHPVEPLPTSPTEKITIKNKHKLPKFLRERIKFIRETKEEIDSIEKDIQATEKENRNRIFKHMNSGAKGLLLAADIYTNLSKIIDAEISRSSNKLKTELKPTRHNLLLTSMIYLSYGELLDYALEKNSIQTEKIDINFAEGFGPRIVRHKLDAVIEKIEDSKLLSKLKKVREKSYKNIKYSEIKKEEKGKLPPAEIMDSMYA